MDGQQTRRCLHTVVELVLAGPQHRESGTIRLRVGTDGIATVAEPALRIDGPRLVVDGRAVALEGRTIADIARDAGVTPGAPENVYQDGSSGGLDDVVHLEPEPLAAIIGALRAGAEALRRFAPEAEPVLWPEHCDLAITVAEVNYGVSPGDGYLDEPYAYVGPWQVPPKPFFNAPFGAARPVRELPTVEDLVGFFERGRAEAT